MGNKSRERSHEKRKKDKRRRRSSSHSSRSRSRSTSRSRSRTRSTTTRSKHQQQRRSRRSYSRSSSDDNSDYNQRREIQHDSYKYQEPNNTIMVRGLASHLSEDDIREDVLKCGIMPKDVRVIRHHDTGLSRGFGFVEFNHVSDASRWMDMKKGLLDFNGRFRANLIYSIPRMPRMDVEGGHQPAIRGDWLCAECHCYNFKKRDFCYKCNSPKPIEEGTTFWDATSSRPTTTIILSNLDILTTEEGVLQAIHSKPDIAAIPIKSVKIARETETCLSRGICYVEANNIPDASRIFTVLSQDEFRVDGKAVSVDYGRTDKLLSLKNNSSASAAAAMALAAAQWTNNVVAPASLITSSQTTGVKTENEIEAMAQYSARLYAKTMEEYTSYLDYYRQYYKQEGKLANESASDNLIRSKSTDSLPTCLQNHPQQHSHLLSKNPVGTYKSCFVPSVKQNAQAQLDEQQFLAQSNEELGRADLVKTLEICKDNIGKKEKVIPKNSEVRGAKEVGNWTKKKAVTANNTVTASSVVTSTYNELLVNFEQPTQKVLESRSQLYSEQANSINVNGDDDKLGVNSCNAIMSRIVDENKMACLLCKRKFSSVEILQKHIKMSELHKKNLEIFQTGSSLYSSSGSAASSYRDRAKERRETVGFDESLSKNVLKDLYLQTKEEQNVSHIEEATQAGIDADNVGNRLLQKMGWQEGQGLGRHNQGGVEIVMMENRVGKLGLGIRAPEAIEKTLDHQTKLRLATLARYKELE